MLSLINDVVSLFYPPLCGGCGAALQEVENMICLECRFGLPRTHYHLQPGNPVEQSFWGRVPIYSAAAFLYFQKGGKVQRMMHRIKYKGQKELAQELGKLYGEELRAESRFAADYIVPVPLHPKKLKLRGFNQAEYFGRGLAEGLGAQLHTSLLIRRRNTETQTKKSRFMRWENVAESFGVYQPEAIAGRHIILVDDVVTTGATLEACAQCLQDVNCALKISIATLAIARH